jgi:hypothetical protein
MRWLVLFLCLMTASCRLYEPPTSIPLTRSVSASPSTILDDPHYLDESHMALRLSEPLSLDGQGDSAYFADRLARTLEEATERCRRTIRHEKGSPVVEVDVELGCREASGQMRATFVGDEAAGDRRVDLEFKDFWMNGHRLTGSWSLVAHPAPPEVSGGPGGYVVAAASPAPYEEPPPQVIPQPSPTPVASGRGYAAILVGRIMWFVVSNVTNVLGSIGDR